MLSSLVECRKALESYLETCLKSGTATDVYVKEADALACGTVPVVVYGTSYKD